MGLSEAGRVGQYLLAHADHDTLMAGASHDAGEDRTRCIITSKARFDHSGPIVAHKGRYLTVVSHCSCRHRSWLPGDDEQC